MIIMLLVGSTREQVMKTVELTDDAIRKIIRAFNLYGVDGLIARKRPGRTPLISGEQKEEILEEFEEPGRAQRTFWTATAFHGHIAEKYQVECSYETVRRLLHEKGYVLKVPQPWPDRQDEEAQREVPRDSLRAGKRPRDRALVRRRDGSGRRAETATELGNERIQAQSGP